jgi:hypothetical protein
MGESKRNIMPQSLSKVYVHIIFSTKNRQNLIDDRIKNSLYEYLGGICKGLKAIIKMDQDKRSGLFQFLLAGWLWYFFN